MKSLLLPLLIVCCVPSAAGGPANPPEPGPAVDIGSIYPGYLIIEEYRNWRRAPMPMMA